jgi:hypothetical protein
MEGLKQVIVEVSAGVMGGAGQSMAFLTVTVMLLVGEVGATMRMSPVLAVGVEAEKVVLYNKNPPAPYNITTRKKKKKTIQFGYKLKN